MKLSDARPSSGDDSDTDSHQRIQPSENITKAIIQTLKSVLGDGNEIRFIDDHSAAICQRPENLAKFAQSIQRQKQAPTMLNALRSARAAKGLRIFFEDESLRYALLSFNAFQRVAGNRRKAADLRKELQRIGALSSTRAGKAGSRDLVKRRIGPKSEPVYFMRVDTSLL